MRCTQIKSLNCNAVSRPKATLINGQKKGRKIISIISSHFIYQSSFFWLLLRCKMDGNVVAISLCCPVQPRKVLHEMFQCQWLKVVTTEHPNTTFKQNLARENFTFIVESQAKQPTNQPSERATTDRSHLTPYIVYNISILYMCADWIGSQPFWMAEDEPKE